MDPRSEKIIGQIVAPALPGPSAEGPPSEPESEPINLAQIVHPRSPNPGAYTGPERRAQGYLIAEVVDEPPADSSHPSDFPL